MVTDVDINIIRTEVLVRIHLCNHIRQKLILFFLDSPFSNGLLQQQPKRNKEKERKKKRSKNSPHSPPHQIIPEGQIADIAIPGTSTAVDGDVVTDCSCPLVLELTKTELSQNSNSATSPILGQPKEESGLQTPAKCVTPAPAVPNACLSQSSLQEVTITSPTITDEYALVKHYADLQNECPVDTLQTPLSNTKSDKNVAQHEDGFCCVISMYDGIVLFTSPTITESLGFPKDMWLGRSFIDFVHPKDRHTFASQISSGVPFAENKSGFCLPKESKNYLYVMLRKYRGLKNFGYGIAGNDVIYEPYKLVLNFREGPDAKKEDGGTALQKKSKPYSTTMLLIISATPVTHFYKRESAHGLSFDGW